MARSLLWFLTAAARSADVPADADLLRRFTATRDGAAFELIVRRHAAGVWSACRGVLRNDADADDAFQATFFTLARKARAVRAGRCLGGWLHRVAVHAALKLRAKRRKLTALPDVTTSPTEADDSAVMLHQELANLPASYREVLVAVDMEGHSHADAAALLGWPVGTVSGRLVRARAELRRRLERRGITAATIAFGAVGGSQVRAAVEVATGATAALPVVESLSSEVWVMIATTKRRLAAAVAAGLLGVVVLGGVAAVAQTPKPPADPTRPADKAPDVKTPPAKAEAGLEVGATKMLDDHPEVKRADGDSPEHAAAKEIILAELERLRLIGQRISSGQFQGGSSYLQVADALSGLTAAAEELYPDPAKQLSWFEFRLAQAKGLEEFNRPRVEQGVEEPQLTAQLRAERFRAELALAKVVRKGKK